MSAPEPHARPGPDPVRRTNLTTLILYRLRDFAIAQGLVEGDRLPPERELASRLSVSRPTLRGALDWLNRRGALRRVQGGGTFLEANFLATLAEGPGDASSKTAKLEEVAEARCALEPLLAKLAAERMTPADAEQLQSTVQRSAQRVDDRQSWHQHDLQFHLEVARLADNSVLGGALHTIMAQVLKVWTAYPERFDPRKSLEGHREIMELLTAGDGEAAAARMQRHLDAFERAARLRPLRVSA